MKLSVVGKRFIKKKRKTTKNQIVINANLFKYIDLLNRAT